jgi:hypothetical protein
MYYKHQFRGKKEEKSKILGVIARFHKHRTKI